MALAFKARERKKPLFSTGSRERERGWGHSGDHKSGNKTKQVDSSSLRQSLYLIVPCLSEFLGSQWLLDKCPLFE